MAQSDDSLKAYLTSIKGSTASMTGYNVSLQGSITGFAKVSSAIKQYNALGTVSLKEQQAFATAVSTTNGKLGTYLIGLNGSTAGLRGYGVSLVASTAKTIGLTVATTALNAAMTMGISVIVTGLISAFTAWINKSEEITEKAQEATDKINSISESLKTNTETVENAKRRYAELAQEVENLGKITQSQGTLSNEEYEEFLDLSNQLAGIFPSLTKNYDENGNAILDLSGDVNTIVSSLDDLIQKEKELANQKIMEEFPDVFKGYAQDVSDAEAKVKSAQTEFDRINQAYNALGKGQSIQMGFLPTGYNKEGTISIGQYEGWLKDLGLTYEEIQVEGGKVVTAVGDIDTAFTSKLETARENLQYAQQQLEGQKSSIDSYLNTWLQTEFSYNQIEDSGLQTAIQDMLFNFDFSNIPENKRGDWNYVSEYLRRNILFEINKVQDDPVISKAISEVFTNAELTPDEKANYLQQIQDFFGEDSAIVISLKPQIEETETLQKQYDDAVTKFGENSQKILEIFFKDNSINDSSEIDYWNNVTEGAKTAEEAVKMYNDAKKNGNESDILSFSDAWEKLKNSTEDATKGLADDLIELAESGKLTVEALSEADSTGYFENLGISADEAVQKINSMVDSATQLQSLSSQISKMSDMLADKKNGTTASASDLSGFDATVKGLESWEEFERVMGSSKSSMEECQAAANALATEWVNNGNFLANLTEENKDYYITQLDNMGVMNAEALVTDRLSTAQLVAQNTEKALSAATTDLSDKQASYTQRSVDAVNATYENSTALATQEGMTNAARIALADLVAEQTIFSNQDLGVTDKITALGELAGAYMGAAAQASFLNKTQGGLNSNYRISPEEAWAQVKDEFSRLDTTIVTPVIKPTGSQNYKPPGGTDKKKEEKPQTGLVDFYEKKINSLNNQLDVLGEKYENIFSIKKKKDNLDEQIDKLKELSKVSDTAAKRYRRQADKITFFKDSKKDAEFKEKIRNGSYNITRYDQDTINKIQRYEDYIGKAEDAESQSRTAKTQEREKQKEKNQLDIDIAQQRKDWLDAEIENTGDSEKKIRLLKKQRTEIGKIYNGEIANAELEHDSVKVKELQAEKEKELTENAKEQWKIREDEAQANIDILNTKIDDASTAKEKIGYLKEQYGYIKDSYKYQIMQADGNTAEVERLEAERDKELNENKKLRHQARIDEAEGNRNLLDTEIGLATTAEKKNKLEKDKIKYIKQSYNEQIKIAKQDNDSLKISKLKVEKEKELLNVKKEILQNTLDQNDKEMALLDAKYQNAASAKEKNKILDQKDAIGSKDVDAYRTNYNDAKKSLSSASKTANKATSNAKSLSDSDRKKIDSYVKSGKVIPDSLLKKVKAVDSAWYNLLVNYNNKYADSSSTITAIRKSNVSQKTQDSLEKTINFGKSISQKTLDNVKKKDPALYKKLSEWNKEQQNRENIITKISSTKTLTSSEKKKIQSLVNAKKPITDSLLQKVASANPSLYAKLVDYNNKLDYLDESKYNLDVAKEQDKTDKANNAKEQFNNLQSQYENRISILNSKAESLNGQMEMVEARGYVVNGDYYNKLIKNTQSNLSELSNELVELRNKRDEMLKDGTLKKGSDDWYEIQNAIWSVKNAQDDATKSIIEYQKQIRQLKWDAFDRQEDFISKIQDEGNFLIDLMSNEKLFADDGNWTEYANAIAGLRAMNYNAYMAQADDYEKEIQAIQQEINNDPYNIDLIQRKQELISTQRELIKSAEQEKESIKSLVSDGYNKWLDALQKSIDLRKNELDSVSDLYTYQKNIAKLAKETANYEKQWLALQGDDSEENKATLQKVTVALQDSRDALQESEYEQWKTDQQKMLDALADDAQEWVNQRLDNIDGLISDVISATNTNSTAIKNTLEKVASDVGITLSSDMTKIWNSTDGVTGVVREYGQSFNDNLTSVGSTLTEIKGYVEKISNTPIQSDSDKDAAESGIGSDTGKDDSFSMDQILKNIKATTFIESNSVKPKNDPKSYSPLNQYIYEKTGKVLPENKQGELASILGITGIGTDTSATDRAKILKALKDARFSKGGTIGKTIKSMGENGVILARTGEEVLSLEKIDKLKETLKLVNPTPNFKAFEPLNAPVRTQNVGNNIDKVEIEINLPNVTNYEEFKSNLIKDRQFEKVIQTMTLGNALGGNTLNKYRIR